MKVSALRAQINQAVRNSADNKASGEAGFTTVFYKAQGLTAPRCALQVHAPRPLPTLYEVIAPFTHRTGRDVLDRTNRRHFYHKSLIVKSPLRTHGRHGAGFIKVPLVLGAMSPWPESKSHTHSGTITGRKGQSGYDLSHSNTSESELKV